MLKIMLLSYFQLLLLTVHSRCLNTRNYAGMMLTNVFIAVIYCTMFRYLTQAINDPWTIVAYATGTTFGGISGVWLHHRFVKERQDEKSK